MRKQKEITVNGETVIVKEMTNSDIYVYAGIVKNQMTDNNEDADAILRGLLCDGLEYQPIVARCVESKTPIEQWGITEYMEVLKTFQEVNSDFFQRSQDKLKVLAETLTKTN